MLYRYRVHDTDGNDVGMAHYAVLIRPGVEIIIGAGQKLRVLASRPVATPTLDKLGVTGSSPVP